MIRGVAVPVALVSSVALLSLSALHDRVSEGRIHPVSLWGGIGVLAWLNVFLGAVAPSPVWRDFTTWLIE